MIVKQAKKKSRTPKKIKIIRYVTLAIAVFLVAVATYLFFIRSGQSNQIDSETSNLTQQQLDKEEAQSSKEAVESSEQVNRSGAVEAEKDTLPAYEGGNPNQADSLSGVISYSSVVGSNLVIRTTINQTVGSGTCQLTLRNGSNVVIKDSGIIQNPSSSTCEGFNVPTAELGGGNWSISIAISGDGKTGTINGNVGI